MGKKPAKPITYWDKICLKAPILDERGLFAAD